MQVAVDFAEQSRELLAFVFAKRGQDFFLKTRGHHFRPFVKGLSLCGAVDKFPSSVKRVSLPTDQVQSLHPSHESGDVVRIGKHQCFEGRLTNRPGSSFAQPSQGNVLVGSKPDFGNPLLENPVEPHPAFPDKGRKFALVGIFIPHKK